MGAAVIPHTERPRDPGGIRILASLLCEVVRGLRRWLPKFGTLSEALGQADVPGLLPGRGPTLPRPSPPMAAHPEVLPGAMLAGGQKR
jgi:hypothetical protein